jgi:glycosyltransferase involved in cell wall biosynthesis
LFEGPVASRSGYGEHCRGIVKSLIADNRFELKIDPVSWGDTPQTALDDGSPLSQKIKKCFLTGPLRERPEVHVHVSLPDAFQPKGTFNVGVTAGIETTLPPAAWIQGLNRMHVNFVPSAFSKAVFENASVIRRYADGRQEQIRLKRPIEVVFEGVDTAIFHKTDAPWVDIDRPLEGIPETFCFLMVGHWLQGQLGADRKDIGMLVKVFCEVFRHRPNAPALILKTSGAAFSSSDKERIQRKIHLIRSAIGDSGLPNVYLVYGDLTQAGMNRLYNHPKVKAHVSFTHGEGYGRPLLEATLSGKPLLATNWSGHKDFLPEDLANLLPGEVRQIHPSAANEWVVKESRWFVADYAVAAQKLDDLFVNYTNYLAKAEMLRKQNAERFTSANEAKLFLQLLEKHLTRFNAGN